MQNKFINAKKLLDKFDKHESQIVCHEKVSDMWLYTA